jgi:hypothetical protein
MVGRSKAASSPTEINVIKIDTGIIRAQLIGVTPFICHAMSAKAKGDILNPSRKKNAAEKAITLKHDVLKEYRESIYALSDEIRYPSLIGMKATAFKGAMMGAALDIPGATKSQIGRLVHVQGEYVSLFGVPELSMMTVRQSGFPPTPDIRTRAIIPRWACEVVIEYIQPMMQPWAVMNLLSWAGKTQGVGDGRTEKGALNYGQFQIVSPDDKEYLEIVRKGGRKAQAKAIEADNPKDYDDETRELRAWYHADVARREMDDRERKPATSRRRRGIGGYDPVVEEAAAAMTMKSGKGG